MTGYLAVLLLYGFGLVLLGFFLAGRVRGTADFFVAGRKLGPGLVFATFLAANIGAGSTVGAAGLGYLLGLSGWWWVGSAGLGSLILALSVGPRLRLLAASHGFYTVGDFLEYRYGSSVRVAVALLLWCGALAILAGQLIAFAWILEAVAQTQKIWGCLIGGCVVITYFTAGGLKGAAWINLIQLLVKGAGFLIAVPVALTATGGWTGLHERLSELGKSESFFQLHGIGGIEIAGFLILLVPSFVVSPGLIQKIFGARDDRSVRLGVGLNAVTLMIFSFFPVLLGMIAAAHFPALIHEELALPSVIVEVLPFGLGALLLAAVFSAEVSSADAILFMLSTSLSKDLYLRFFNPGADDARLLRVSRLIAFSSGLLAVLFAIFLDSVVSALRLFYALLSVALFAPLVIGLYRSRPGKRLCLTAILISVVGAALFDWMTSGEGWGFITTTAFGIVLSSLTLSLAYLRPARP